MNAQQSPQLLIPDTDKIDDESYLKIWEIEQEHAHTRWTVATFFMSVSFAIFGLSFQQGLHPTYDNMVRIAGMAVYWFAYLLFVRFYEFSKFLRGYIRELEISKRTHFDVQTKADKALSKGITGHLSAYRLLLLFGVLYTVAVLLIWWFT